jgi:dCMP deaminase
MTKIDYHTYFLTMTYLVATRSPDPSTKCGAVLVSKDKRVLSTGYNGPIKGVDDSKIPLERPAKYAHILHAEENCLLAYAGSNQDLDGATMYVTGAPCHKCLRMIIQKGVHNIVYSKGNVAVMQKDDVEQGYYRLMLEYAPHVKVLVLDNLREISNLLDVTKDYIKTKNPQVFS